MIVITGGAGFIGSAVAWELNNRGRTDLLIVDGNPDEDIDVLYDGENVECVIKDGTVESATEEYRHHYSIRESQPPGRGE